MRHPTAPAQLGARRLELERILARSSDSVPALAERVADVADPLTLHVLLYLELCAIVKRGPAVSRREDLQPARVLAVAQRAAQLGVVPLATPHALRRCLEDLGAKLKAAGAWRAEEPLWWDPLPALSPEDTLWRDWQRGDGPLRLPSPDAIAAAFGDGDDAPQRLQLSNLVPISLLREIHDEAEAAFHRGALELKRAGVGASGSTSTYRWDESGFFAGTERRLLEAGPTLAAFVQWCLGPLGEELAEAMPRHTPFPPQKAMLARYPAPSGGFAAHLDNPGGEHDNGRVLTLVIYLNPPEKPCRGGELMMWAPGTFDREPPVEVVSPRGGTGALFDARMIPHQVDPLLKGPHRWALTVWFNDTPTHPLSLRPLPRLTVTDALLPIEAPPLPEDAVLFHELADEDASGQITVHGARPPWPRVGLVSTVYRGRGILDAWCAHHFDLGIEHIVLVFDHLDEPAEAADAARLTARYGSSRLTIWSGQRLLDEKWPALPGVDELDDLRKLAQGGAASSAVAARQSLCASTALVAARDGSLGGPRLDWLLHLDVDEWFYVEGAGRGGATLGGHLAAAQDTGLDVIRYLNHELLLPWEADSAPRFKVNPRLAAARLGPQGWSSMVRQMSMSQSDRRPYFRAYHNGKAAVRVAAGALAAGVHGWTLADGSAEDRETILAGPSVLHFHLPTARAFREKYLGMADSPASESGRPFEPSPLETAALDLIHAARASGETRVTIEEQLDALYREVTGFSEPEIELLDRAGLLTTPDLAHVPPTA